MEMLVIPHRVLEGLNENKTKPKKWLCGGTAVIPVTLEQQSCINPGRRDSDSGNDGDLTTTLVA